MKTTDLVFSDVTSVKDFFAGLKKQLALPPHFGGNLDALYDYFTTDAAGAFSITWASYAADCKKDDALQAIGEVLYRATLERQDFKIDLAPPKKKR